MTDEVQVVGDIIYIDSKTAPVTVSSWLSHVHDITTRECLKNRYGPKCEDSK